MCSSTSHWMLLEVWTPLQRSVVVIRGLYTNSPVQVSALLKSYDCQTAERVLYPELVPVVAPEMSVGLSQRLPLKRECVVTSGSSLFLVDSHRSIVLYRLYGCY